jgi:hypothetical protein
MNSENPQTATRLSKGQSLGGRPRKFNSPCELEVLVDEYFATEDGKNSPSVFGLALACDFPSIEALDNFGGYYETKDEEELKEYYKIVSRAKYKILRFLDKICVRDKGSPQGAIHRQKVMGYIPTEKHEISGNLTIADIAAQMSGDKD